MKALKDMTTIFIISIIEVSLISGFLVIIRILHGDNYLIVLSCAYDHTSQDCELRRNCDIECYLTHILTG